MSHDPATPGNDFEQRLADRLRARAERTRVDLDHDRIRGQATASRRNVGGDRVPGRFAPAMAFGVVALVIGGLVALALTRDPDDEVPSVGSAPSVPPPPTEPPPPTYGELDETDGPTIEDHWHVAYGFWLCGEWFQLSGNLEEMDAAGQFISAAYLSTGIHSHDDGVIHVHPFTSQAEGDNATLGLFLANYGVELTDDTIRYPDDQDAAGGCQVGPDRSFVVAVWPDAADTDGRPIIIRDGKAGTPLRDGSAITIAVVDSVEALDAIPPPPWADDLPALAAVDAAAMPPDDLLATFPSYPATTPTQTFPPVGGIIDFAKCGQPVTGPAADLGIETVQIDVAPDRSSFELTLRNTTPDPIRVGVAPFLATLDADGFVASRPSQVGVWQYQVVPPGEPFTIPVDEAVPDAWVLGLVACPNTLLPPGAHEFVVVLDVGGTIVSSDPVVLTVTDGGVVVASSVPTP